MCKFEWLGYLECPFLLVYDFAGCVRQGIQEARRVDCITVRDAEKCTFLEAFVICIVLVRPVGGIEHSGLAVLVLNEYRVILKVADCVARSGDLVVDHERKANGYPAYDVRLLSNGVLYCGRRV